MQIITSLEELRQKAVGYRAVPVAGELFSDVRTPIEVLRILKNVYLTNEKMRCIVAL